MWAAGTNALATRLQFQMSAGEIMPITPVECSCRT